MAHSRKNRPLYADYKWLTEKIRAGYSDQAIADLLPQATSPRTVGDWRRYFGLQYSRKGLPKNEPWRDRFAAWLGPRLKILPLNDREIEVLQRFFGIRKPREAESTIGESLAGGAKSVSRQYVSQVLHRALGKIVAAVGRQALRDFPEALRRAKPLSQRRLKSLAKLPRRRPVHLSERPASHP
ncbi:hypothetical protein HY628_02095 [Candidatus Uhrbacteria bacterium]|nr:hypothetical protein [Candidatus Uhrbacteria bacterium]